MSKAFNDAQPPRGKRLLVLCLGTLGVVYGDIATSPLYAIRECFHGEYGIEPRPANVLGVLSLMFWALVIIVCFKYLVFVLRADNHGEGGVTRFALFLTALLLGFQSSSKLAAAYSVASSTLLRRLARGDYGKAGFGPFVKRKTLYKPETGK